MEVASCPPSRRGGEDMPPEAVLFGRSVLPGPPQTQYCSLQGHPGSAHGLPVWVPDFSFFSSGRFWGSSDVPGGWLLATNWHHQLGRGLCGAQPARCLHQPAGSPLLGAEDCARSAAARALGEQRGPRERLSWDLEMNSL